MFEFGQLVIHRAHLQPPCVHPDPTTLNLAWLRTDTYKHDNVHVVDRTYNKSEIM